MQAKAVEQVIAGLKSAGVSVACYPPVMNAGSTGRLAAGGMRILLRELRCAARHTGKAYIPREIEPPWGLTGGLPLFYHAAVP
jgi:hypothetical protein